MTEVRASKSSDAASDRHVEAVRRFSRFYTRRLGLLHRRLLASPFSVAEGRVLFELAQHTKTTASELGMHLGLDPGYLSRILNRFTRDGLVTRRRSDADRRRIGLTLTKAGRNAFAVINRRSHEQVAAMLAELAPGQLNRLTGALAEVEHLLADAPATPSPILLRSPEPGDIGWIIHRHGALYAREYGFDHSFEALVAQIASAFLADHDPAREQCWVAEREGEVVGSVFVVSQSQTIAKLRLLYVEPAARGAGIGRQLVEQAVRFARRSGYRKMTLWTNDILTAACKIYQDQGFVLQREERHFSFGRHLVGQYWDLDLLR